MHVKHVKVKGFRGIACLDWTVNGTVIGLVGPGDSTKTTMLDAIEYTLSPRWSLPISDCDFYGGEPQSPILIEVTVGDIPGELLRDERFGLLARGWRPNIGIVDEPSDDSELVLTVRLSIGTDLEPSWAVVADRDAEGKGIAARDRARLGAVRLGAEVNRDLAWGKGSSLARMTGSVEVDSVLAEAYRAARATVAQGQLDKLVKAADTAAQHARRFGATLATGFTPALDSAAMSATAGALSLHDGPVPVRASGLGTRRLVALAIQQAILPDGAILLIDEVEYALEPHRIRRLLRQLRSGIRAGDEAPGRAVRHGQVIMTTHSPVAVAELDASEIRVVRSDDGVTRTRTPDSQLQGVVRSVPDALLARRVVVCEGPTEVGLCWGMEDHWKDRHSGESVACRGVVIVDGGGSSAPSRAQALASLGYEVAYFADSDREVIPTVEELSLAGVTVTCWAGATSTEERVFSDLPWRFVQEAFDLAIQDHGSESVIAAAASQLGRSTASLTSCLDSWRDASTSEETIRAALGRAANGKGKRSPWYKRRDRAEQLAKIVVNAFPSIQHTDLATKLQALESWCYD